MALVVHITPESVLRDSRYKQWLERFVSWFNFSSCSYVNFSTNCRYELELGQMQVQDIFYVCCCLVTAEVTNL